MKRRLFLPRFRQQHGGFSLVELLVAMFITGIMMMLMTGFFQATSTAKHSMTAHNEAQQGLRSFLSVLSQELRQAGVCLPIGGQLPPVQGTDAGTQDSLTILIGRAQPVTSSCITSTPTAVVPARSTNFSIQDTTPGLFRAGDYVYILPTPGAVGSFHTVAAVAGATLTLDSPLPVALNTASSVSALDQRIYRIDPSAYGSPVLTVAMNGGAPQPLVDGVEVFDLRYFGNCTPTGCAQLTQPTTPASWAQVRQVGIRGTVRSRHQTKDGQWVRETTGLPGAAGEYINVSLRTQRAVRN